MAADSCPTVQRRAVQEGNLGLEETNQRAEADTACLQMLASVEEHHHDPIHPWEAGKSRILGRPGRQGRRWEHHADSAVLVAGYSDELEPVHLVSDRKVKSEADDIDCDCLFDQKEGNGNLNMGFLRFSDKNVFTSGIFHHQTEACLPV